jgi:hypothetical protein
LQLYGRGTFRERAIGALEKEGVDMPSELMGRFALLSLRFRVEKETPFLKALKASLFCLKNLPMTAAIGTVPSVSNADVRTPDVASPTSDARLSGHRTGNFALQTQFLSGPRTGLRKDDQGSSEPSSLVRESGM